MNIVSSFVLPEVRDFGIIGGQIASISPKSQNGSYIRFHSLTGDKLGEVFIQGTTEAKILSQSVLCNEENEFRTLNVLAGGVTWSIPDSLLDVWEAQLLAKYYIIFGSNRNEEYFIYIIDIESGTYKAIPNPFQLGVFYHFLNLEHVIFIHQNKINLASIDGKLIWSSELEPYLGKSRAAWHQIKVHDNIVLVTLENRKLVGVDLATGTIRWHRNIFERFAYLDGKVFCFGYKIPTKYTYVYILDAATGEFILPETEIVYPDNAWMANFAECQVPNGDLIGIFNRTAFLIWNWRTQEYLLRIPSPVPHRVDWRHTRWIDNRLFVRDVENNLSVFELTA